MPVLDIPHHTTRRDLSQTPSRWGLTNPYYVHRAEHGVPSPGPGCLPISKPRCSMSRTTRWLMNECCEGRFRRFRASTTLSHSLCGDEKPDVTPRSPRPPPGRAQVHHVCCAGCHPWHHQARRLESTRVLPLSLRWRGRGTVSSRTKAPAMQALLRSMREHANSQREDPGPPMTGAFQEAALQADRLP